MTRLKLTVARKDDGYAYTVTDEEGRVRAHGWTRGSRRDGLEEGRAEMARLGVPARCECVDHHDDGCPRAAYCLECPETLTNKEGVCPECEADASERAYDAWVSDYYGGSSPQTVNEQYQAAAAQKRGLDR